MTTAERPVETVTAVEIQTRWPSAFYFMDFHRCLKKPPQRTLRLFHSYHRPGGGYSIVWRIETEQPMLLLPV